MINSSIRAASDVGTLNLRNMSTQESMLILNWRRYNAFLQKQDSLLADIFKHYQGKKPHYEYERVLATLLHRYALNFRSIYKCWEGFRNDSKFKFPIYTLLRPLLADFILMLYLLEEFKFLVPKDGENNSEEWKVNETDFVKRYESISTSFFERVDSYLKKKVKNSELSYIEMLDFLSSHKELYPELFHETPRLQVIKNRGLTPAQMADQIVYGKQFVKNLYDYYFRLSQFEHFTMVTEGLMYDHDHNSEILYIVEITDHILDSLTINLSTLRAPQELKEKLISFINEFRTIEWLGRHIQ